MVYLLPIGASEVQNIPNVLTGSFRTKLETSLIEEVAMVEISDEEYDLFKDTLQACEVEVFVVIMIPDVITPKSFLHELDDSIIINFNKLDLIKKDDDDEFMNKLRMNEEKSDSSDDSENQE